jgi:SSS family solute:Na+ symporter
MLDNIALLSVLASFLVLGIAFTKKTERFKEYALGIKNYPTPILIATMVATMIGGAATLGNSAGVFQYGIWFLLALFSIPIGFIFTAYFILPKLTKYYGCISVADILGRMYGKNARIISGILGSLYCFGAFAAQLIAIMFVLQNIWGSDSKLMLIVASLIIILYTAIGGARSVIATDVLQFAIVLIFFPIVCTIVIKYYGGFDAILDQLPTSKFEFNSDTALIFFGYGAFGILPDANPSFIQRLLMSRKLEQLRTVMYSLILAEIPIIIVVGSIAIIGITQFSEVSANEIFFVVAKKALPAFMYMILGIVLIAIIVSTADSLLNACAVLLVRDVIVQVKKLTDKDQVVWVRVIGGIAGIISLFIALAQNNIVDTIIFFGGIYIVAVTVPLYLGLFYKTHNSNTFYYSTIITSLLFIFLCFKYPQYEYIVFLVCLGVNIGLYILLSIYYKYRGLNPINTTPSLISKLPKLQLSINVRHETLAIFMLITFFSIIFRQHFVYNSDMLFIGESVGAIAFIILFLDYIFHINSKLANIRSTIMVLGSWYVFSFVPFYMYYYYKDDSIWLIQSVFSLFILGWSFSWPVYILQVVIGLILATLVHIEIGDINIQALMSSSFQLSLYVSLILLSVFILFKKYEQSNKLIDENIYLEKIEAQDHFQNIILEGQNHFELNTPKLASLLKQYFAIDILNKKINLEIVSSSEYIKSNITISDIYKLIFSIIYYLIKISEYRKNIGINISGNSNNLTVHFNMDNNNIHINDIQKYIRNFNPNPGSKILNWSQIKILAETLDYKFEVKDNEIIVESATNFINKNNIIYFKK